MALHGLLSKARRATWLRRGGLALLVLVGLAVVASFFMDEPIRRLLVRQMNRNLKGYTATIRAVNFHPIGLSLTVRDLSFAQEAHPDPPVLQVRRLDASVQWRALLRARLVANFELTRARALRQSSTAAGRGRRPDAARGPRMAGGVRGHLPLEDQPRAHLERYRHVRRRRPLRTAGDHAAQCDCPEHPEHPVQGAHLPLGPAPRRRDLQDRAGCHRRPRGLPRQADPGHSGRRRARGREPGLLQARAQPRQRVDPGRQPVGGGGLRIRTYRAGRRPEAGDHQQREGRIHQHAPDGRRSREGRAEDRSGRRGGEQRAGPASPRPECRDHRQSGRVRQQADHAVVSGVRRRCPPAHRELHEPADGRRDGGHRHGAVHGQRADTGRGALPPGGRRTGFRHEGGHRLDRSHDHERHAARPRQVRRRQRNCFRSTPSWR